MNLPLPKSKKVVHHNDSFNDEEKLLASTSLVQSSSSDQEYKKIDKSDGIKKSLKFKANPITHTSFNDDDIAVSKEGEGEFTPSDKKKKVNYGEVLPNLSYKYVSVPELNTEEEIADIESNVAQNDLLMGVDEGVSKDDLSNNSSESVLNITFDHADREDNFY